MKRKDRIFTCLYMIIAAFVCLSLASRSSELYVFNNWDDANSYFSVGKGIFNGKMPYRDIFDQKGFYLYFIYGIGYLISHTTFAGVFLIEVLLGSIDILGFYNIIRLFTTRRSALITAPLVFGSVVCSRSFWWGGSAEEICLPFLIWGLYLITEFFIEYYPVKMMPAKKLIIAGCLAGMIANIKFTGLGFYFAWMMLVFLAFIAMKKVKEAFIACGYFLLGMAIPFVPAAVYFGVQNGLYDWYWGYVYVNVFVYNEAETSGGIAVIYSLAKVLYWLIRDNFQYFELVIPGMIFMLLRRKSKILTRLYVPVLFLFMFIGIFGGGRELPYYSLPLSIFAVFGGILLSYLFDFIFKYQSRGMGNAVLPMMAMMLSMIFITFNSMNIPFMSQSEEDFFLFRFRDEVLESQNPTLLNVGCLDAGLYTLCDIVPSCRWFQTQTLNIEEEENNPYKEQERYIREGLVDYVLARDEEPAGIDDHYTLIDSEVYDQGNYIFTYYLYKKTR